MTFLLKLPYTLKKVYFSLKKSTHVTSKINSSCNTSQKVKWELKWPWNL